MRVNTNILFSSRFTYGRRGPIVFSESQHQKLRNCPNGEAFKKEVDTICWATEVNAWKTGNSAPYH